MDLAHLTESTPREPTALGTEPRTVALQMLDVLRAHGVDTVFGIPGGAVSAMYAATMERPDVRVVNARHETGAVFLAMGYAMSTGRPSVVLTTAGPGVTNALTGLASAHYEHLPVIVIAGEVPRASFGRGALQEGSAAEIDTVGLARKMTRFAAQIARGSSAVTTLRAALAAALAPRRGPALLTLPLDVANERVGETALALAPRVAFDLDDTLCRAASALLCDAERPLVIAGAGAREPASRRALRSLVERLSLPVVVTPKGKGVFPEDHPLYLGVIGFGGHESAIDYLKGGTDVLLACGTGLNDFATNAWSPVLRPRRALVQIDVDPSRISRNFHADIGLVGPLDVVATRLLERVPEMTARRRHTPEGVRFDPAPPSPTGALTTAEVVLTLNEICPPGSVFTADMGEHLAAALHYLRVRGESDFVTCLGFGSMGSGICSAIGLQLGNPSRRAFAICGDGGFAMYGAELATAVSLEVGVTFVVINDARFNMVHHGMRDLYGRTPDVSTRPIDFAAVAHAYGADGRIVRTRADLVTAICAPTREKNRPLVLDVRVDPDARLGGSQRNAALRQFKEEGS